MDLAYKMIYVQKSSSAIKIKHGERKTVCEYQALICWCCRKFADSRKLDLDEFTYLI